MLLLIALIGTLKKYGNKTAIIWVGDEPGKSKEISYGGSS